MITKNDKPVKDHSCATLCQFENDPRDPYRAG